MLARPFSRSENIPAIAHPAFANVGGKGEMWEGWDGWDDGWAKGKGKFNMMLAKGKGKGPAT